MTHDDSVHPRLSQPSAPDLPLPEGACDCHVHVFERLDEIPIATPRHAKSRLAPFRAFCGVMERVGFSRAVLVQPTAYGDNHAAMLQGLSASQGKMRGIAVKGPEVSERELDILHSAGVRGLRFNQLVGGGNNIGIQHLPALASRLKARGWHAQLYATCDYLAEALPSLLSLDVPIVIDHLARVGPEMRSLSDPAFLFVRDVLKDGGIWLKLTAYRNSRQPGSYVDMRPFHDAFIAANPRQVLWGSDWPYLSAGDDPPDTGHLIDLFNSWTSDADLRRLILTDNPQDLYAFDQSGDRT